MTPNPDDKSTENTDESANQARKERVIHTRVPAVLEQELKRLAGSLRVPVSNVVRAILEDAVAAVDVVGRRAEGDLRGIAERLAHKRDRLKGMAGRGKADSAEQQGDEPAQDEPSQEPDVLGYQPFMLASEMRCGACGRALDAGSEAFLGILRDPTAPRVVIGRECLPGSKSNETKEDKP
ncbi:MAG: hypothetical protein HY898_20650 [Deltaproteobacteria bacterium]|nr:hypothetical protein [Deltaproteobacteria bacterium]